MLYDECPRCGREYASEVHRRRRTFRVVLYENTGERHACYTKEAHGADCVCEECWARVQPGARPLAVAAPPKTPPAPPKQAPRPGGAPPRRPPAPDPGLAGVLR